MTAKPVVARARARHDVDEAVTHYLAKASPSVAYGFIGALEVAYAHIARHPATGSLRYAHELDLPGLRAWGLKRFPYLVFYVDRDDHIDVWRVLHGTRDIAAWLRDDEHEPH